MGNNKWEKALLLAGASNAKAMVMQPGFLSIKERRCPRCNGMMQDVMVGKRTAMYCSKDRVVIPHPIEDN